MNGFLGSPILEAAIALNVVYVMLALFCSTLNEWIAMLTHARAAGLRATVRNLLGGELADRFNAHPLVTALREGGHYPGHLPARLFSTVLLDLLSEQEPGALCFDTLCEGIGQLPSDGTRAALSALMRNTQGDPLQVQNNVETWFNDAMDRATARYKRRAQVITLGLAISITLLINADTLAILRGLWPAAANLPLGWTTAWPSRVMGWVLTAGAVSLGAPFWFDVLNRFTKLRAGHRTERHTV